MYFRPYSEYFVVTCRARTFFIQCACCCLYLDNTATNYVALIKRSRCNRLCSFNKTIRFNRLRQANRLHKTTAVRVHETKPTYLSTLTIGHIALAWALAPLAMPKLKLYTFLESRTPRILLFVLTKNCVWSPREVGLI